VLGGRWRVGCKIEAEPRMTCDKIFDRYYSSYSFELDRLRPPCFFAVGAKDVDAHTGFRIDELQQGSRGRVIRVNVIEEEIAAKALWNLIESIDDEVDVVKWASCNQRSLRQQVQLNREAASEHEPREIVVPKPAENMTNAPGISG
jgi:predicted acetyltransferase